MNNPISRRVLGRMERKTDRLDAIAGGLRERIVGGFWAPGERLPNRVEIENSFSASSATVQIALDKLKQEGFVVANRRSGTFVSANPPHLSHFALVFPCHPDALDWNRFWTAICEEAKKVEAKGERRLPIFYGVDGHEDSEGYQNLVRAVEQRRLAGIIYGNTPDMLLHTPLFGDVPIPSVAVASDSRIPWMPVVQPHTSLFVERSVAHLAERGCKKIAVLRTANGKTDFESAIRQCGLQTRDWWIQDISLWQPFTARGVAHLLMHPNQTELPDGLIIADDNLLGPASQGLAAAGVPGRMPLEIVAHCNFPWPAESFVPVQRIGFDVSRLVATCIQLVEAQRQGQPYEIQNLQPAVTQQEWQAQSHGS